jgi:hypothetical protein
LSAKEPDWLDFSATLACKVCGQPSVRGSYLCQRCRHLSNRIDTRKDDLGKNRKFDRTARLHAMWKQWSPDDSAFRCAYTNIVLSGTYGGRRYATWEHIIPADESSVVLVADLVNKMKSSMSFPEFRTIVLALAQVFEGGSFDETAFPPNPPTKVPEEP